MYQKCQISHRNFLHIRDQKQNFSVNLSTSQISHYDFFLKTNNQKLDFSVHLLKKSNKPLSVTHLKFIPLNRKPTHYFHFQIVMNTLKSVLYFDCERPLGNIVIYHYGTRI